MSSQAPSPRKVTRWRGFKLLAIFLIAGALIDLGTNAKSNADVRGFVSSWQTGLKQVSVWTLWQNFLIGGQQAVLESTGDLSRGYSPKVGPATGLAWAYGAVSYTVEHSWSAGWLSRAMVVVYCAALVFVLVPIATKNNSSGSCLFLAPLASIAVLLALSCAAWALWAALSLFLYLCGGLLQITSLVATLGLPAAWIWSAAMSTWQQTATETLAPENKPAS